MSTNYKNNKEDWWKESIIYQIYPRSFYDSNGDGIGDLNGILNKLDYFVELGVDVLWLSPIYKSPNDDNGYDVSDYQEIMNEFGTMDDFDRLLEEAHKSGLKIMLDLVVNHTSDEHPWFLDSKSSKDSEYRDFYIWREGSFEELPNHWESFFGGSVWNFDEKTEMYYLHLFSKKQPDLNWDNVSVRTKIYEMMSWWLAKGIDGFRMDVINFISKADGLPEGEVIPGTDYTEKNPFIVCGPRIHEYLKEMNREVLSSQNLVTVGEAPSISVEQAIKITDPNEKELNMVFQFEHMDVENENMSKWTDSRFNLVKLKSILGKWQSGLNSIGWNSLYWNNHDQPRVVSRFGNDGLYWKESAKMLATCLHLMKGTPYIYQGEEIGMTNIALDRIEEYKDIETLNAYKTYTNELGVSKEKMMRCIHARSRDNARTPMQWDDTAHAGFTSGTPWFNVNKAYKEINVKSQLMDDSSIFHYYKKLIQLRKKHEIIVCGDFELFLPESEELFVYMRKLKDKILLVVCNFTDKEVCFRSPVNNCHIKQSELLISNYSDDQYEQNIQLKPFESRVYLLTTFNK